MQKRELQAGHSMMQGNSVFYQSAEGDATKSGSPTTRRVTGLVGLFLALTLAAGCSGDTTGTGSGGSSGAGGSGNLDVATDGLVTCALPSDPVDTYLPNMSKVGANRLLTFTLVQSDHAPPIRDRNIWKLKVTKADQTQYTDELVPDVKMPKHMHPPGVQPKVTYDATQGLHIADPIYLFMPGYWSAEFTVYQGPASSGEVVDRATFFFCVD